MKLNKRGFTIIESVITFMVIAIAGSMLIVGIFNIVNIFTESSTIKTETNRLYNELVNESDTVIKGTDGDMVFTFQDDSTQNVSVKDYYIELNKPIFIKLFAFDPLKKAEMLPGQKEPDEPEIVVGKKGILNILTNPSAVAHDRISFSDYGSNPSHYGYRVIFDNLFKEELGLISPGFIYGERVNGLMANIPTLSQLETGYNQLPLNYKKAMGLTSFKKSRIIYDAILNTHPLMGITPEIYAHFLPEGEGILLKYTPYGQHNNFTFVWCDIQKNGNSYKLKIPSDIIFANPNFTVTLDNNKTKTYDLENFSKCDFLNDGAIQLNGHYFAQALN